MDRQQRHTGKPPASGHARSLALATAAIACLLHVPAHAASNFHIDCEKGKGFLSKAHAADTLDTLTMDAVDLAAPGIDSAGTRAASADGQDGDLDESLAPLLYLGPRVNSILNNVFETEDGYVDAALPETRSSVSPMADTENTDEEAPTVGESPLRIQPTLLKIHRQMYRTDI